MTRRKLLWALAALAELRCVPAHAETPAFSRRLVVVDDLTGFAIGGYDPLAYFVEGRPRPGDKNFQLDWHGATWLFNSEGNMAAFQESPQIYAPVFGGYCAYAVSQGFPAEGNPNHFAIIDKQLYLFASPANRIAFLEGGASILVRARQKWPDVSRDLP